MAGFPVARRCAVACAVSVWMGFGHAFAVGSTPANASPAPTDAPAAWVDGVAIPADRLWRETNRLLPVDGYHNVSAERRRNVRRRALDNLIDEELLYREGRRRGFRWDDDWVERTYAATRERYAQDAATYEALGEHATRARLFEELRRSQVISRLITAGQSGLRVEPRELVRHYNEARAKFRTPKILHVRELSIPVEPGSPKAVWDDVKSYAESAYERIVAGEPMDEFVRKPDETGRGAHEVRERTLDAATADPGFKPLFGMEEGELSPPLSSLRGYSVIRVERVTPSRDLAFEEVKTLVERELLDRKRAEWIAALTKTLREKATVRVGDMDGDRAGP